MRQADSTIKGYLYQFNKSIYEILKAEDDESITLEGVIEDIDIQSPSSLTTIQCKYHEDKKYQISSVATPILEMLCHYCESVALGKSVSYILYAYYVENTDCVSIEAFTDFLDTTKDKDIQCKYFHRIYTIPDETILAIALKPQKKKEDKLVDYYKEHRDDLELKVSIENFWNKFTYVPAEQFDALQDKIIALFDKIVDSDTAKKLYYPNSFSLVANLSSKTNPEDRIITRSKMLAYLQKQQSVLLNRWTLAAMDRSRILRDKKNYLLGYFAGNSEVRAFIFSDKFLAANHDNIFPFIVEYLSKYFKKPKLQKQPIFVFGNRSSELQQFVLLGLHQYQKTANNGTVGDCFVEESFVHNTNCPANFSCKLTLEKNITATILEKCQVNQLYIVGKIEETFESPNYFIEILDIENINDLRYLVGLSKKLEV